MAKPMGRDCRGRILFPLMLLAIAGCSILPASGPSRKAIIDYYQEESRKLGVELIDLTPQQVAAADAASNRSPDNSFVLGKPVPTDMIGVGDALMISIFQTGPGLFGPAGSPPAAAAPGGTGLPQGVPQSSTSSSIVLPVLVVDRNGMITVPYGGRLAVAGKTPPEVEEMIERALAHGIFEPQVVVDVRATNSNVYTVLGDVRNPGRFPIAQGEKLLDGIATAGGPAHADVDEAITLFRDKRVVTGRLHDVERNEANNVLLQARDRVQMTYDPLSFTVFGATGKVQEVTFDRNRITLAEAIARTSGPNDDLADIAGIFLFRFEPPQVVNPHAAPNGAAVPVVYHMDLSDPQSFFMMKEMIVSNQDLVYIADAQAVQIKKFFSLIGQLFAPAQATKVITQ